MRGVFSYSYLVWFLFYTDLQSYYWEKGNLFSGQFFFSYFVSYLFFNDLDVVINYKILLRFIKISTWFFSIRVLFLTILYFLIQNKQPTMKRQFKNTSPNSMIYIPVFGPEIIYQLIIFLYPFQIFLVHRPVLFFVVLSKFLNFFQNFKYFSL